MYFKSLNTPILWLGLPREYWILPLFLSATPIILTVSSQSIIWGIISIFVAPFCFFALLFIRKDCIEDPYILFYLLDNKKIAKEMKNKLSKYTPLNIATFEDNHQLALKNGRMMKVYRISYFDFSELENILSYIEAFKDLLDENDIFHAIEFRKENPNFSAGEFSNNFAQKVEDDRIALIKKNKSYSSEFFITFITDSQKFEDIENKLSSKTKSFNVLESCELINFIARCCGETLDIKETNSVFFEDNFDPDFLTSEGTINGNDFVVLAIDGFPTQLDVRLTNTLSDLGMKYRISTRFVGEKKKKIEKKTEKQIRFWQQSGQRFSKVIQNESSTEDNAYTMNMVEDAKEARKSIQLGKNIFGYMAYNIVFSVDNPNEKQEIIEKVKALRIRIDEHLGTSCRIEAENHNQALLGTIPGNYEYNKRTQIVSSECFFQVLNINSRFTGYEKNPSAFMPENSPALSKFDLVGKGIFNFNIHHGNIGFCSITGASGSGKSTLVNTIIAQFLRYEDARVIVFEKGEALRPFIKALGGKYLMGNDDGNFRISLLDELDFDSESEKSNFIRTILTMLSLNNTKYGESDDEVRESLTKALKEVGGLSRINPEEEESITFEQYVEQIQDDGIKNALSTYVQGSFFSGQIDSFQYSLNSSSVVGIDLSILDMEDVIRVPVLISIMDRVEQNVSGRPLLIVFDEAQFIELNNFLIERVKRFLDTLRKFNVAIIFSTLSPSRYTTPSLQSIIQQSTLVKIFLNTVIDTDKEITAHLNFGLKENEIENIKKLRDHTALIKTPTTTSTVQLHISEYERIFGTATKKKITYCKQYSGDDFVNDYVKKFGNV